MKSPLAFILTLLIVSLAPAFAQTAKKAETPAIEAAKPVKKVYKKTESHLFSGAKLKGQLKKPDLSYIYQRKGLRAEQIVNVPENFDAEINAGAGQF